MTPLGLHLRHLRAERGITQREMAEGIGVSPAYLSALEHGRRGKPSFALLQRMIGYLGIIWDETDELQAAAALSDPKVAIDTSGLSAEATELANRLARDIATLDKDEMAALLNVLRTKSG